MPRTPPMTAGANDTVVVDPARLLRIMATTWAVQTAIGAEALDEASRRRLDLLRRRLTEDLTRALSGELACELGRLVPGTGGGLPTDGEIRVLHAQLGGWLAGVLDGEAFVAADRQDAERATTERHGREHAGA